MKEIWKDIVGFEDIYKISNFGRVKSFHGRKEKILSKRVHSGGYISYCLSKDGKSSYRFGHRLVAAHFLLELENKTEVNHIDGDKKNNHVDNLEWCSRKENIYHAKDVLGHDVMYKCGEKHPLTYMTDKSLIEIKSLIADRCPVIFISWGFNCGRGVVGRLKSGETGRHLQ